MQIPFAKRRLQAPGCGICIALPDMQPSSCRFLFPRKSRFYPLPSRGKNPSANVPALLPGYVLPHHKHYTKHLFACKVCESICPGGSFPFSSRGLSWLGTGICLFFSPDTPQDGVFFSAPVPDSDWIVPLFQTNVPCFHTIKALFSFLSGERIFLPQIRHACPWRGHLPADPLSLWCVRPVLLIRVFRRPIRTLCGHGPCEGHAKHTPFNPGGNVCILHGSILINAARPSAP